MHGLGNGVRSRQEIRFPLRRIDKEEVIGGREEGPGLGVSCRVVYKKLSLKDRHPHLPRSTMAMAETQTPPFLLSSHRIHGH